MKKTSLSRKIFIVVNTCILTLVTISCVVPILNVLATSFSSAQYINAGEIGLLPKGFTLAAYKLVIQDNRFWMSLWVTAKRMLLGVPISLILTILMAYPLSKSEHRFKQRPFYVTFFLITMIFNGGLVPTYLVIYKLGLFDSVWALVLPTAVNVFNAILLMNFFRNLPKEIEESALMDGANQWTILWRIMLPLAKPAIATVALFTIILQWNSWLDGLLYNNFTRNYPLQTYLQTMVAQSSEVTKTVSSISDSLTRSQVIDRNLTAAKIFVSIVPLMMAYPFLQKHFTKGLVLGSVKG